MNKKHLKAVPDKPVMDDKLNTPTDIDKFGGGKKVDKKTRLKTSINKLLRE